MQVRKEQLIRQQMIMTVLNYYRHKCDGIWGPASIEAKKKWESDKSFIPGLPNSGLPLGDRDIMPKNVYVDPVSKLLCHRELTDEKLAELNPSPVKEKEEVKEELPVIPASGTISSDSDESNKQADAQPAQGPEASAVTATNTQNKHPNQHRKGRKR